MRTGAYVGRLAPSPTGALHLGNARTFLIAWLRCRARGGRLILRVEDLDHPKIKHGATEDIYADLRWLGLDWDEGPDRAAPTGGGAEPYIQSQRLAVYRPYFERLVRDGLVYPCVCSRADIMAAQSAPHAGEELRYPNLCRGRFADAEEARRASGRYPAWRFRAPEGASSFHDVFCGLQVGDLQDFSGDFVIARGDDQPAYQLAVVVDDALMGVTEVVRADDLLLSTHRQLALYRALGFAPPDFLHPPLLVGEDGLRLAKRHGDTRIAAVRAAGTAAGKVLGWLAWTCGWAERGEELTPETLLPRFRLDTICPRPWVVTQEDHRVLGL